MKLFAQLNLLYLALLSGQLLFAGVVFFLLSNGMAGGRQPPGESFFQTLIPLVILGAIAAAYFIHRRRQTEGSLLDGLQEKAAHYRASVITRSALLEGANLMAVIAALVEQNSSYLGYFAVGLLAFLYFRPSRGAFVREYALSQQEEQELAKMGNRE